MEDLAKILAEKIEKSQALLAKWNDAKTPLSDKDALRQLNNILDISVLTALKELNEVRQLLATQPKIDQAKTY